MDPDPLGIFEDEGIVDDSSCARGGVVGKLLDSTDVAGEETSRWGGTAPD